MPWRHGVCKCCGPTGEPCGLCTPPLDKIAITLTGFTPHNTTVPCTEGPSNCGGVTITLDHTQSYTDPNGTFLALNQALGTTSCTFSAVDEVGERSCVRTVLTGDPTWTCTNPCLNFSPIPISSRISIRLGVLFGFISVAEIHLFSIMTRMVQLGCVGPFGSDCSKRQYDSVQEIEMLICPGSASISVANFCAGMPLSWACPANLQNVCQTPPPIGSMTPYTVSVVKA